MDLISAAATKKQDGSIASGRQQRPTEQAAQGAQGRAWGAGAEPPPQSDTKARL